MSPTLQTIEDPHVEECVFLYLPTHSPRIPFQMGLPLPVGRKRPIWKTIVGANGLGGGWDWVIMPFHPTPKAAGG